MALFLSFWHSCLSWYTNNTVNGKLAAASLGFVLDLALTTTLYMFGWIKRSQQGFWQERCWTECSTCISCFQRPTMWSWVRYLWCGFQSTLQDCQLKMSSRIMFYKGLSSRRQGEEFLCTGIPYAHFGRRHYSQCLWMICSWTVREFP